ncbi:hypothetical protein BDR05DRAFT_952257 [Suillus weaverae]|nr:hypothetical protein BDR05DRAFT_952257 [Suillus weaverae]
MINGTLLQALLLQALLLQAFFLQALLQALPLLVGAFLRALLHVLSGQPEHQTQNTTTLTTDPDEESDIFPLTPNSKHSGGACNTINISAGVHSPDAHGSNHYHPYCWPPLFEEKHFFERFSACVTGEEQSQDVSCKVVESYLRHIEGMSPHTFHCAVHYKEAIRETLHMDYYSGLWRHEAAQRLCAFQGSLNTERKAQFRKAEQESRWLLNILVERNAMSAAITDVQYLAAARDDNARALRMADIELDILKGETQSHNGRSDASRAVDTYDGEVSFGNIDWEDSGLNSNSFPNPYHDGEARGGHYLNPYINPYFLLHRDPPQLDTYLDDPPHPNLGDYHPSFSLPVMSMDGTFTLPSKAEDHLTMTVQISESQAGLSRTVKRRLPKKHCDDPFIHYSPTPSLRKGKKKASNLKPLVSNEPPSTHSIATKTPLPSVSGSALTAAGAALLPMLYDKTNLVHQQIVEAAQQNILDHAVNVCSMLGDQDVNLLVHEMLVKAVTSHCHDQKFCENWAGANLEVEHGYKLRPSVWSSDSESNRKKSKVKDLVDDHTIPLKFTFRKDEETDKLWPLEHEVVWDIVISAISELKLQRHIKNLDNLFCTAAAVVHCALCELRDGKMVDIVFSAVNCKQIYDQLMDYIIKDIALNAELAKRWNDFKACTITRLEDILN